MKKIIALLMAFIMLAGMLPAALISVSAEEFFVKKVSVKNPVLYDGLNFLEGSDKNLFYFPSFLIELQNGTVIDRVYGSDRNYTFQTGNVYHSLNFSFEEYENKTLEAGKTYTAYAEIEGHEFPITLTTEANPVESISVKASKKIPLKYGYFDSESKTVKYSISTANPVATLKFSDGSTKSVSLNEMIKINDDYYFFDYGFVSAKQVPGKNRAFAEICEKRCEFDVYIEESNVDKMSVTGSIVLDATKDGIFYGHNDTVNYDYSNALKRNPVKINVTYKNATKKTFTLNGTYNENNPQFGYYTDSKGAEKAVVIFGGKTVEVPIKIVNASSASKITKISLVKLPDFPCGIMNHSTILWDKIQVKLTFASGKTETATLTSSMRKGDGYYYTAKNGVKYVISFSSYIGDEKKINAYACGKSFTIKEKVKTNSIESITVLTAADKINSEALRIKIKFADSAEKTVTLNKTVALGGMGGIMGYNYSSLPIFYDTGLGFILEAVNSVTIKSGKATRTVWIYFDSTYSSAVKAVGTTDATKALAADITAYSGIAKEKFIGTQTAENTDSMVLDAVRYYEFLNKDNYDGKYTVAEVNQMVKNLFAVKTFDSSKSSYCNSGIIEINDEMALSYVYRYNGNFTKNGNDTEFKIDGGDIQYVITVDSNNRIKKIAPSASNYKFTVTSSTVYSGKAQKPAVTASKLKENKDYTVTYKNNTNAGVATATVKGITFTGTVNLTFKITPKQVTGLKSSDIKTTSLKLSWSKTAGAKYYKVEQSTDGKKWKTVTTTDKTSYTVKSLKAGTKYQFRVTALDSTKKIAGKASSVLKTGTLTKAPTLTLKSSKSKTATASWKKVTGASKYVVYKSANGKKWTKATTTTKTSYNLTKLTGGKKIYVRVTALNAYSKASAYSSSKNVTVKK